MSTQFFAHSHPVEDAERIFFQALQTERRGLGLMNHHGEPTSKITDIEMLDPSVMRLAKYLYDNPDLVVSKRAHVLVGHPNHKQLMIDLEKLRDGGVVELLLHNGSMVAVLSLHGEELLDDEFYDIEEEKEIVS